MTWIAVNMESSSIFERASLSSIGEKAKHVLVLSSHGKILASFSSAVYLNSSQKELFWLTAEGDPMHRRGVEVRGVLPGPAKGSTYRIQDGALELEGGFQLDLNLPDVWRPECVRSEGLPDLSEISQTLLATMTSLEDFPSPKGFGCFLPEIAHMVGDGSAPLEIYPESPVLHLAWPSIREFIAAVSAHDHAQALQSASQLIGLGEGLTPSGDDFVGGILFTWKTLAGVYKKSSEFSQGNLESLLAHAKRNTNIISYTILADHVFGHGSEVLHQLINALLVGEPLERLNNIVSRAVAVGHSTGWDILAGVLTGMPLWIKENAAMKVQVT